MSARADLRRILETRARFLLPFARRTARQLYVGRLAWLRLRGRRAVFNLYYQRNSWGSAESVSGPGSDLQTTEYLRDTLAAVLRQQEVKSILDAPCGDFNWMKAVPFDGDYVGADIVPAIIQHNTDLYANARRRFMVADIVEDDLPYADFVLCRDCLVHLSFADGIQAIRNLLRTGCRYFAATTFTSRTRNADIVTGDWRPINLELAPYMLPKPMLMVNEQYTGDNGQYPDKSSAIWDAELMRQTAGRMRRLAYRPTAGRTGNLS